MTDYEYIYQQAKKALFKENVGEDRIKNAADGIQKEET